MNTIADKLNSGSILIDVRSPGEYAQGHVPGAENIPLLSDESRKTVGIAYKNQGQEVAVLEGFRLAGPLFASMIEQAKLLAAGKPILLYCWRGGMRSQTMAWIFKMAGLEIQIIPGGYKAYRKTVQEGLSKPFQLKILGGFTGTGKTEVLQAMRQAGAQVIDLEALAKHRGSAFGSFGMPPQPSVEQFENLLIDQLNRFDLQKTIWLEDESRKIGAVALHPDFWVQKDSAPLYRLYMSEEERILRIKNEYTPFGVEMLENAATKIGKRLGPQHLKEAIESLHGGDFEHFIRKMLVYYDKTYAWSLEKRAGKEVASIDGTGKSPSSIAHELINLPD